MIECLPRKDEALGRKEKRRRRKRKKKRRNSVCIFREVSSSSLRYFICQTVLLYKSQVLHSMSIY
jgi:hypothetical protein